MLSTSARNINLASVTAKIDSLIFLFLCILTFWIPYSPAVIESCVVSASLLWLIKRALSVDVGNLTGLPLRKKMTGVLKAFKPQDSFLNKPIFIFIFFCFLSMLASPFTERALQGFFSKTLEWFIVYFLVIETVRDRRGLYWILGIFNFTSLATCFDGIVQFHLTHKDFFYGRDPGRTGATAAFKTYNDLGGYLTFFLAMMFGKLFIRKKESLVRFFDIAVFLICAWTVVITFSRGAWAGIILGILFSLFFINHKVFTAISFCLITAVVCFYAFSSVQTREKFRLEEGNVHGTAEARSEIWRESLPMIKERPLFGHGPNTFMAVFQPYRKFSYEPTYTHNCYIQIACEFGMVGLLCFLWIMATLFKMITKTIINPIVRDSAFRLILLGLLSGALAFLVHSFVDTHFYSLQLEVLFWFMVGILVVIDKILKVEAGYDIKVA